MFQILKKIPKRLRLWGNKLTILQLMKTSAFCSQKWFSNRAAKLPRDVTLVADYIVILVCFFSTTSLSKELYQMLNSDSSLDIFSVLERDSVKRAGVIKSFATKVTSQSGKTRSSLRTLFDRKNGTLNNSKMAEIFVGLKI